MTRLVKILIALAAGFVIMVIAAVAVGFYWWSQRGHEIVRAGQKVVEDGGAYGKTTDEQHCLEETLSRYKKDPGLINSVSDSLFLRSCLDQSKPTAGFCEGAPRSSEILKSPQWQREQCKKAGISDSYCHQLFAQVQQHCEQKDLKSKRNSSPSTKP